MPSTRHSSGALEALFSVFVAPTLPRAQLRTLSCNARLRYGPSKPAELRTQRWNGEIRHRMITLVNPETNQPDPTPRETYDVLRQLDEKTHRLVQLTPDPSPVFDPHYTPLCKIQSKKDEYDREQARKAAAKGAKKARALESSVKTLELNWAAAPNDLAHRLDKVREFLDQGRKVEIVLAVKKRGRRATRDECEDLLRAIRKVVEEVEGAREIRPMDGKVGAFATLSLQGRPPRVGAKKKEGREMAMETPKDDKPGVEA